MKINVTKTDIKLGERENGNNCAVARAVKRATKIKKVFVDGFQITVNNTVFDAPNSVTDFVLAYDSHFSFNRVNIKPFTFDLPVKKQNKKLVKKTNRTVHVKHDLVPALV